MSQIKIDVASLTPALQTAFSYLSEGNWRNANDCFDLALKSSPLDPYACLGKAMTAACLKTPDELNYCTGEILDEPFFSAALKYAEGDLKNELTQLVVRLNYEKQKAQSQRSAIETTQQESFFLPTDAPESELAEAAADPADSAVKANWSMEAVVERGDAPESETAEKTDETGDVVSFVKKKKSKKKVIAIVAVLAVLLIGAGAAVAWFYLIPMMKYNKAVDLINAKQFDEGLAIFEELGDFSDAAEQYKVGLYVKGLNYLAENDFENCKVIFEELGDFKDSQELLGSLDLRRVSLEVRTIAAAEEGDIVTFGTFETDGNEDNGAEPLRWVVLRNRDDLVTLTTEQSIAGMRFHFNAGMTSWAESSLRSWLNGTFFTTAFDVTEADFVCKNYITTPANPDFPSPVGEATVDKVYLLSMNEALTYFRKVGDRKLTCTPASYPDTFTDDSDNCCWWLRTSGARLESAMGVDPSGQVMTVGYDCYKNDQIGVRPVIAVDISGVGGSSSDAAETKATETDAEEPTRFTAPTTEPATGRTTEVPTYIVSGTTEPQTGSQP